MKRKNDDSAALLPTEETQESTNNQEERQQDGDVQMQNVAVASPNKSRQRQKSQLGYTQGNHSVRTKWIKVQEVLPEMVMNVCKDFTNKDNFVAQLGTIFSVVFGGGKQVWQRFLLVSTQSV